MPRPQKCRRIGFNPEFRSFKPAGVPGKSLDEVIMTIDELESVRLVDLEGMYQEDAAKKLNVSRQTLGNIITTAHKKVAECLVNGKILKIEGGNIKMEDKREFLCKECEHKWFLPFGTGRPENCPACKSENIGRVFHNDEVGKGSGRRRRHHGSCKENH